MYQGLQIMFYIFTTFQSYKVQKPKAAAGFYP